jgi:serine/threonine protein kinase
MDLENISHYKIVRTIGSGGMGEVFLAEDTRLKRKVALKMLPIESGADASKVARFEKEARAASALNHPHILTVYDVGEIDSCRYIVTEFVDGQTLRDYFSHGRVPLQKALNIITDVANALSAAHDAGIVHRDVKPENIMIRKDGMVKVLDFGLAKLTEAETAENTLVVTAPGMIMGTPKYMSPEQVRGLDVDRRSDIFSLGIVFYEMVAGVPPFDGATVSDVIAAVLTRDPAPLFEYKLEIPSAVQKIIHRCLEKDSGERYQTMTSLIFDLERCDPNKDFIDEELSVTLQMPVTTNENVTTLFDINTNAGTTVALRGNSVGDKSAPRDIRKRKLPYAVVAGAVTVLLIGLGGLSFWLASGNGENKTNDTYSRIPVRVIDPLGGEDEDATDDKRSSLEVAEKELDASDLPNIKADLPKSEDAELNVSADLLADRQNKAFEGRPGESGIRPAGLNVPTELFGAGVIKQREKLTQMNNAGYSELMDFADLAEKRLNDELAELPMATQSFYLDVGGSAEAGPFSSFNFRTGQAEIRPGDPKYQTLKRLADNFAGKRYNMQSASDRKQIRRRLLRMLQPQAKPILEEVAAAYHGRFGRPLRITSLTRSTDYQVFLNGGNLNFLLTPGESTMPPHSSGYAFDIARKHMPVDEQNFMMQKLAEMERGGVLDALIEYGANACFHIFVYPIEKDGA